MPLNGALTILDDGGQVVAEALDARDLGQLRRALSSYKSDIRRRDQVYSLLPALERVLKVLEPPPPTKADTTGQKEIPIADVAEAGDAGSVSAFMTRAEAGKLFGKSSKTVTRWIASGRLPTVDGQLRRVDVEALAGLR